MVRWALVAAAAVVVSLVAVGLATRSDRQAPTEGAEPEPASEAAGSRPNIVVVLTDDQDFRSVRAMESVRRLLGRGGTRFERAYATFPLCCPARATLLTGLYSHNHGVVDNKPPEGGFPAFRGRRHTIGVWLQRAGYRTAWIGKFLNAYGLDGRYPIPPGWSRWHAFVEQSELRMYGYRLNENGTVRSYGSSPRAYQTDVLARKAGRFVESSARRPQPFFLVMATLAPHDEDDRIDTGGRDPRPAPRHRGAELPAALLRPPASFDERDVSDKARRVRTSPRLSVAERRRVRRLRRSRLESLMAVDEAVAMLVRTLRRSGELDRTVIVFTTDNGYMLGEHRQVGGKSLPYEEAARVPLLIRGPGFPAGERRTQIVGDVDLTPTFLELAGADPTRRPDGVSLLGPAADPGAGADRALLLESGAMRAVRTSRWLYVDYVKGGRELYDTEADPLQLRSLAGSPPLADTEAALTAQLEALADCSGGGCVSEYRSAGP
jgi:N-acetylglucosamine-6-sulfatase